MKNSENFEPFFLWLSSYFFFFPTLLLGEVETNRVVAPENATEAKQLAANAEKLRKQCCKVSTKDVAETRLRRGRSVTKQKLEAKTNDAKTEGSSR